MSRLFQKGKIQTLELKNRLVMAPMCMYQSDESGLVTPWHVVHYATRASGGVGLIILEATAIEPRGRITDRDLGIWSDTHIEGLKTIVDEVHKHGAKIGIQLAHAGRKSTTEGEAIIAPSAAPFSDRYRTPKEMTLEDIKLILNQFKEGARRADEAGFDLIEIHAAHGYLINQFLSPITNKRIDIYGGSLENRLRFLNETIDCVKEVWPNDKPLIVRLSAEEYAEGGHHIEESISVVNDIKQKVDAFNISSGGVVLTDIHPYAGYQIPLSEQIKLSCDVKTIGGGLLTSYDMLNEVVENGRADFVYLGRLLLRDPYFPLMAAKKIGLEEVIPQPYKRGF